MNVWHEVSRGERIPEEINTIIEIPRGSANKYELDKVTGLIRLDRANYSSAHYPFDYGFIPQTLWDDGDPLDVLVLSTFPLYPEVLVEVRPVGGIDMIDSGKSDYKVIAVPVEDRRWEHVHNIEDLNPHNVKEYQHFFETYKLLKGKPSPVEIRGIRDKKDALAAIERSIDLYKQKFPDRS